MKRFTETTKWRDPWFRRLSPTAKLLWLYLTDDCDCTGLIDLDIEAASFHIGAEITENHLSELVNRVQRTIDGKIFIPRFIPFQYGVLSGSCPAHKPVLKLITQRNLKINGKGYSYPTDNLSLDYVATQRRVQEKEKDKEKSTEGGVQRGIRQTTKFGYPLPSRCSISRNGDVLDYTGRIMDINQVRNAAQAEKLL